RRDHQAPFKRPTSSPIQIMEIALIIGGLIGLALGVLFAGVILRIAARWVLKEEIALGDACVTQIINTVVQAVLGFLVGFVVGSVTRSQDAVNIASILMLPVGFLIQSGIIATYLKVAFGKACLISLAMMGIALAIL